MSNLDMFDTGTPAENRAEARPDGVPFYAVVECQLCGEPVDEQTLYPTEKLLLWTCTQGHRSVLENFKVF